MSSAGPDFPDSDDQKETSVPGAAFSPHAATPRSEHYRRHEAGRESADVECWKDSFFADVENRKKLIRIAGRLGARDVAEAMEYADHALEELCKASGRIDNPIGWARKRIFWKILATRKEERRIQEALLHTANQAKTSFWANWNEHAAVERVCSILDSLPPVQREVMALYYDGYKPFEIAALLNSTPGAVRTSLCDARRRLRQRPEVVELAETLFRPSRRRVHLNQAKELPTASPSPRKEKS
jgi:RNA polymerase sigma-70 factor (ECF subfamily)